MVMPRESGREVRDADAVADDRGSHPKLNEREK